MMAEPNELRDQDDAAERLNVSPRTLEKWRITGQGPAYHKIGSRVYYRICDLDAWLNAQRRTSTSQPFEVSA